MSGMEMLESADQFKVLVMQAIAQSAADLRNQEYDMLATKIANAVARMLGAKG